MANKKESTYKAFVDKYGSPTTYELEAVEPEKLQEMLTESIDMFLDIDAFNAELKREEEAQKYLAEARVALKKALPGILPRIQGQL
jgi:hypothetical protein